MTIWTLVAPKVTIGYKGLWIFREGMDGLGQSQLLYQLQSFPLYHHGDAWCKCQMIHVMQFFFTFGQLLFGLASGKSR